MRRFLLSLSGLMVLLGAVFAPSFAFAQDAGGSGAGGADAGLGSRIWGQLRRSASTADYLTGNNEQDVLSRTIAGALRIFMGILGTVAVILIIYAGYLWTTAGGNEDQVGQAKGIIKQTVVGMAIVVLAYAIVSFVFSVVLGLNSGN